MVRHFRHILDLSATEAQALVLRAMRMKQEAYRSSLLHGRTVVMLFEKASTRTRLSFEVAVDHLDGRTIFMTPWESQLGRNEPLKDTARVVSRYADAMVVRTFGQEKIDEITAFSSVPVINALSDKFHPCQVMSDVLTMVERFPDLTDLRVAWVGDGNNMANSWINAAVLFGFDLRIAAPKGFEPDPDVFDSARRLGARVMLTHDPAEAVEGARFVNTDVWASMGQEKEQAERMKAFEGFRVDDELLRPADPDVLVMHCLPAHRGEEISEAVLEGPRSIVWDQAENRLHMQKAILEWVFTEKREK